MNPRANPWIWFTIWTVSLGSRLLAAFLLPNAEQDGYSYADKIDLLTKHLAQLGWSELYVIRLPLFQLTSAVANVFLHNALLAGKILSGLCGAISCVLVFALTKRLTQSLVWAGIAFALVLTNPLHLLYSAACMTDVPHVCLVLASLWFLLQERWLGAAICAALAGSVRLESWALIPLLPLLQFVRQRRISLFALVLLLLPPLLWLLISYMAKGDPFAYFADRAAYHANYLDFYPTRHGFALADLRTDADYFLLGANEIIFLASLAAIGLTIFQFVRQSDRASWPALSTSAYIAALFGLLLLAYVTKRQPVILPRYSLIFFALGLPLAAWLLQYVLDHCQPRLVIVGAAILLGCFTVGEWRRQIPIITKVRDDFGAHEQICRALKSALPQLEPGACCFSDDVAIRVLSGLPPSRFLRSAIAPAAAWREKAVFESYLQEQHGALLVFARIEDSIPPKVLPDLGRVSSADVGKFEFVIMAPSSFGPDIWLYRVRDVPRPQ